MEYKNIEKFESFLLSVLSDRCFSLPVWLDDFENQIGETGAEHYEVSGSYTRTGNPEIIYFKRIDKFFLNGKEVEPIDNDFDYAETTIVF